MGSSARRYRVQAHLLRRRAGHAPTGTRDSDKPIEMRVAFWRFWPDAAHISFSLRSAADSRTSRWVQWFPLPVSVNTIRWDTNIG